MYDGLDRVPIRGFKQLRERVQILQDRYDALLRRYPQMNINGGAGEANEIDWSNIITPLIRAQVNRVQLRAAINSDQLAIITSRPIDGRARDADGNMTELNRSAIYLYEGEEAAELWYWSGNEWKSSNKIFSSEFVQTPVGFQFSGTMELKTNTNGRETKLQIGYDDESQNNNPYIIFGAGSGAAYDKNATDKNGQPAPWAGQLKTNSAMGYPLLYGQAALYKTVQGLRICAVSGDGYARWLEVRSASQASGEESGVFYCYETATGEYDEKGEPVKVLNEDKIF